MEHDNVCTFLSCVNFQVENLSIPDKDTGNDKGTSSEHSQANGINDHQLALMPSDAPRVAEIKENDMPLVVLSKYKSMTTPPTIDYMDEDGGWVVEIWLNETTLLASLRYCGSPSNQTKKAMKQLVALEALKV